MVYAPCGNGTSYENDMELARHAYYCSACKEAQYQNLKDLLRKARNEIMDKVPLEIRNAALYDCINGALGELAVGPNECRYCGTGNIHLPDCTEPK